MLSGDVETNPGPGTGESVAVISGYIESSPFSAAVADDNTAVYEVFRAHFDQLVQAMTSPTALIPVLYSKRLISILIRPDSPHSLILTISTRPPGY